MSALAVVRHRGSLKAQPVPQTEQSVLRWALWEHLNGDRAYAERGLWEFREYDGCSLPFNVESDQFDYDQLPLHGSTAVGGGTGIIFQGTSHERDWIKMRQVVARKTTNDLSSAEIERDAKAITARLRGPQNRQKLLRLIAENWPDKVASPDPGLGMQQNPNGCRCEFAFDEAPQPDPKFGGVPRQWIWAYTVTLYGPGRTVL